MIKIIVSNQITLRDVTPPFMQTIRERLTMPNPKYVDAVKRDRWTGNLEKELRFYRDTPAGMTVPRGFVLQLLQMATKTEVSWQIEDQRRTLPEVEFTFAGKLRDYQADAVKDVYPMILAS